MTAAQRRRLYFPAWKSCAAANGWVMSRGRLLAATEEQRAEMERWPEPAREAGLKVLAVAEDCAAGEHRAANADDLRRGCNVIAAGVASSKQFRSRRSLNQFLRLCALLRDPEDLDAVGAWLNPDEDDRRRAVKYMASLAHEARLRAISFRAWGVEEWDTLPLTRLDSLLNEIQWRGWTRRKHGIISKTVTSRLTRELTYSSAERKHDRRK